MKFEQLNISDWLDSYLFPLAILLLASCLIIILNRHRWNDWWITWRSYRSLKQLGIAQIHNAVFHDGLDGYFTADRLVMLNDSIVLIVHKPYVGSIYCSDHIFEWSQIIGQKSFKFRNPLFELENQLKTIQSLIPDVNVKGFLFFNNSTKFPRGYPDRVLQPDSVPDYLYGTNCPHPGTRVIDAWKELQSLSNQLDQDTGISYKA